MYAYVKDPFARLYTVIIGRFNVKVVISDVNCHGSSPDQRSAARGYIADNDSLSVVSSGVRRRGLRRDNATASRNLIKDRHIISSRPALSRFSLPLPALTTSSRLLSLFYYLSGVSARTTKASPTASSTLSLFLSLSVPDFI